MVSVEIQSDQVFQNSGKFLQDIMELTNLENFKLEIYTGQMSPVLNKDLRQLRELKTFHLRQKPQSNHAFKRSIKASDINILLQVHKPDQFEFVLDYVDCTFKFKDLRQIIEVNNFGLLRAYVNTLKY